MADFETAYYLTNKIEGGYANDQYDKGGETYRGIARNFHPGWPGWKIIDYHKKTCSSVKELNRILEADKNLQESIQKFYEIEFWQAINGDLIPDQRIANEVYDNAVNMGIEQSGKYLQRAINILNRNKNRNYVEITVDGKIGSRTIETLKQCVELNGARRVLNVINGFQMKHYIELMEKNPQNERYAGWFDRVEIVWS